MPHEQLALAIYAHASFEPHSKVPERSYDGAEVDHHHADTVNASKINEASVAPEKACTEEAATTETPSSEAMFTPTSSPNLSEGDQDQYHDVEVPTTPPPPPPVQPVEQVPGVSDTPAPVPSTSSTAPPAQSISPVQTSSTPVLPSVITPAPTPPSQISPPTSQSSSPKPGPENTAVNSPSKMPVYSSPPQPQQFTPLPTAQMRGQCRMLYLLEAGQTQDKAVPKPHPVFVSQLWPGIYLVIVMYGNDRHDPETRNVTSLMRNALSDIAEFITVRAF